MRSAHDPPRAPAPGGHTTRTPAPGGHAGGREGLGGRDDRRQEKPAAQRRRLLLAFALCALMVPLGGCTQQGPDDFLILRVEGVITRDPPAADPRLGEVECDPQAPDTRIEVASAFLVVPEDALRQARSMGILVWLRVEAPGGQCPASTVFTPFSEDGTVSLAMPGREDLDIRFARSGDTLRVDGQPRQPGDSWTKTLDYTVATPDGPVRYAGEVRFTVEGPWSHDSVQAQAKRQGFGIATAEEGYWREA